MKQVGRRTILGWGLGAGTLLLLGCDVEPEAAAPEPAAPEPAAPQPGPPAAASSAWVVNPPSFAVGSNATFNLANTLPAGVARGGAFGVSSAGATLPVGMTLTLAGILSVGSATIGSVAGVVFTYAIP